jgi:hypothetical protein
LLHGVWPRLGDPESGRPPGFHRDVGDELAKQDMELAGAEPGHSLPDMPQARGAAQGVAEIDALIRAEKRAEATRRYQDLTAATWNQAIDTIRGWRDLKLGQ